MHSDMHHAMQSPNIMGVTSRGMRMMGHVACKGDRRATHRILEGKPEGN
jgi:hypothetical protein